ncbi:MAG: hypothetical protein K2O12_07225, partial [Muribaculaceae bacterium]|nr:hypothetical protein [Muribaculaceae bacterium]
KFRHEVKFLQIFDITDKMFVDLVARGDQDSVACDRVGLERSLPMIRCVMKGLIMRELFEDGSYYRVVNTLNPIFKAGLDAINDKERYTRLLSGK